MVTELRKESVEILFECPRCFFLHSKGIRSRPVSRAELTMHSMERTFLSYMSWYSAQGRLPGELGGSRSALLESVDDKAWGRIRGSGQRLIAGESIYEYYDDDRGIFLDPARSVRLQIKPESFLEGNDGKLTPLLIEVKTFNDQFQPEILAFNLFLQAEVLRMNGNSVADSGYVLRFSPFIEDLFVDLGKVENTTTRISEQRPVWEHELREFDFSIIDTSALISSISSILGARSPPAASRKCHYCRMQ